MSQVVPRVNPSVAWTKLPDGAVLFSPESEVYYSMNQVGALIWELLPQAGLDMTALCLAIRERFPDESLEQIAFDTDELLGDLARNGLVTGLETPSAA
jgi:hypothetical protein